MNQTVFLHETDDQGFPRCMCSSCRERSITINAQYVARLFGGIIKAGHDETQEHEDRSQDYSEAGGMK